MLNNMLKEVNKIYIAYGATDFRKQIYSLSSIVKDTYKMDPYDKSAYIFCNKKRSSIKILCYDKNGFVLAQKTLLATGNMKFKWPRNPAELKNINKEQLNWLLSGLKIEQKGSFKDIKIDMENVAG